MWADLVCSGRSALLRAAAWTPVCPVDTAVARVLPIGGASKIVGSLGKHGKILYRHRSASFRHYFRESEFPTTVLGSAAGSGARMFRLAPIRNHLSVQARWLFVGLRGVPSRAGRPVARCGAQVAALPRGLSESAVDLGKYGAVRCRYSEGAVARCHEVGIPGVAVVDLQSDEAGGGVVRGSTKSHLTCTDR